MLVSLQTGTRVLMTEVEKCRALLVVLGDQPEIDATVIAAVLNTYQKTGKPLVIPSYQMRRGHPWLVDQCLWKDLLAMPPDLTMRDFLSGRTEKVAYAVVDTPSILKDLDTPEDYRRSRSNLNK
jgi:molybdenum cofactor cytidylyltransferase